MERLESVSRTRLAHTPTPLLPAPALATHLGAPGGIFIKADAWTGFGLGGNKVRKLEYELSPGRLKGVTHLITAGGPQSNHARVTAAAAAHLGFDCTLIINGESTDRPRGNARLHKLLGADIVWVSDRSDRATAMEERAKAVEAGGGKAPIIPLGASTPRGALGYVRAAQEIREQLGADQAPTIFVASSSGGTLAGLILGSALFDWGPTIVAISADEPAESILQTAVRLAADAGALLTDSRDLQEQVQRAAQRVRVTDDFVGAGYGVSTPEGHAATTTFGRYAGVILDPVYTAKAGAAMLSLMDTSRLNIFLHTGGHPALFR